MNVSQIEMTELGEVAEFVRGINFKPDDVVPESTLGVVACMRTKNVQEELDQSDVWFVGRQFVKREDQMLSQGDILISSANSWNLVGKCCWIPELPWESSFGGFVTVLRANRKKTFPRYLYHWFSSPHVQDFARSFGRQTTNISNLDINRCLKLPFPLPPLSEQKRIAEILDRAEALRAKRRAALALLDELTQSIFLDMFGDPIANPHNFPIKKMIDIVDSNRPISYGILMPGPDQSSGVKYVRVVDMKNGGIDAGSVRSTTEEISKSFKRSVLVPGDLLMSIRGHVGRCAIVPPELDGANITQDTARLAVVGISPVFVMECLRTIAFQRWMAKNTKGVAVRGINLGDVKLMPVIVPPTKDQESFTERIVAIEQLKVGCRLSLSELDQLFASLQHRAFRGEL